jgi:flagellar biosynthesis chaperone FliJ
MVVHLQSLISLRRNAEDAAGQALAQAIAVREREERQQERLAEAWRTARQGLDEEKQRQQAAPAPATAAIGQARALYRRRLEGEVTRAATIAAQHRDTVFAGAVRREETARQALAQARAEREAVEKLEAAKETEAQKIADRRAEDAASDLAQAARIRRKSDSH